MVNPEPIHPKSQLRHQMRRILRKTPLDSNPIVRALDDWLTQHSHFQTLAVFSALPGEVELTTLMASHPNRRWAFPRVLGDDLVFHLVKNPEFELIFGAFGILEPTPALPQISIADIDAFFCPGLAFDLQGNRLGRGKGFYDRMLAKARPDARKIGVCFPCQIVTHTHSELHDVQMDVVISGTSFSTSSASSAAPPPRSRNR